MFKKLMFAALLSAPALAVAEGGSLYIEPVKAEPGAVAELTVMLDMTADNGLDGQFDITLPDGLTFAMNGAAVDAVCGDALAGYSIDTRVMDEATGKLRVMFYNDGAQTPLPVGPVEIMTIRAEVAGTFSAAANGSLGNVKISYPDTEADNGVFKDYILEDSKFTVTPFIFVKEVSFTETEMTVYAGEPFSATATVAPEDATDKTLTWTISDETLATVSETGEVTPLAPGTVTVTATAADGSGVNAECTVTILRRAESITLDKTEFEGVEGSELTLVATVLPDDTSDKTVIWTSSDAAVATVSDAGVVVLLKAGTADIKAATSDGSNLTTNCKLTVKEPVYPVTSVTLDASSRELTEGDNFTLAATVLPENATDKTLVWNSSDSAVATVSENGLVTAVKAGTVTITATTADGTNLSASCAVTVKPLVYPATSVTLDAAAKELTEGESFTLTATVLPENTTDKSVTWTSSDVTVATVSAAGEVTAVKAGSATITATTADGTNLKASCTITVKAAIVKATSITLDATSKEGVEGGDFTLTAIVKPDNTTDKSVTWKTSDATVATVSATGVVTLVKAGTATITATTADGSNLSASCKVTVKPLVHAATSISISEKSKELTEGESFTLTATVKPDNATDKSVTWTSSDASVVKVSADGVVTAVKAGTATITAVTNDGTNLKASCTVTVKAAIVKATSITFDATSKEGVEGGNFTLTATVKPDNTTDKSVTWKTSDATVATVSATGVVTFVKAGTATITATTADGSNLSASCKVTVKPLVHAVTSISLSATSKELTEGESFTLTATVKPDNATDKSVTWTTSNASVATVSAAGVVTAVKAGTATITATTADGTNLKASCTVTVKAAIVKATSITLDATSKEGVEGGNFTLTATVKPENTTDKSVTWTSSDATVATVSAAGVVTFVKAGTATITVTTADGTNLSASCTVNVKPLVHAVTSISISETSKELTEGESFTLTATVKPDNATNKSVTWTSSDASVATVSSVGVVTAVKAGTATITATTNDGTNLKASCTVTVKAAIVKATSITLDANSKEGVEGGNFTLTATVKPDNTTDKSVTWKSSDATVATVSAAGVVTFVKAGTATITVTTADGTNLSASCKVTVKPLVHAAASISISATSMELTEGESFTLTATVKPDNATDRSVTWTSSDATVATVSAAGVVTAVKAGTATITAVTNDGTNLKASCTVTVKAAIVKATSITLDATSKEGVEGGNFTLTATVKPDNATDKSVVWTTSDATVATVSATGVVTLVKAGTATITATTADGSNLSASCKVTVKPLVHAAASISISATSMELTEGESFTLTATVKPDNATDRSVTWTSSDATVATVSAAGVVTAVKAGTATITAVTNDGTNLKASCTVTVKAAIVKATSITLDATSKEGVEGGNFTLTATVKPDNTTDKSVTWKTSDATVATVSATGVVTLVKAGSVTITATTADGTNLKASCTVTVKAAIVKATSITLDATSKEGVEGGNFTLTATVKPDNTTDKSVVWTTSDATVATVSATGVVTLVKAGTATITATTADGSNLSASCKITVKPLVHAATSISISEKSKELTEGELFTLTATVKPDNATDRSVTWTSSDATVATVSAAGVVTAVKAGTATITAVTNDGTNLKASCTVTVKAAIVKATSITLDATSKEGVEGGNFTLTATVKPDNTTDKSVVWTTSDATVATVSATGVVTFVKAGTATITATTADGSNLSASCKITVKPLVHAATSISISEKSKELTEGELFTLTATVKPDNATDRSVTWTSSDATVATVSAAGVVTAVKAGTATITAITNDGTNLKASCTVTVKAAIVKATSITLDETSLDMTEGDVFMLTATVMPDNTTEKRVVWMSSNTDVATVSEDGTVCAVGAGHATVTATTTDGSGLSAICEVNVSAAFIFVESITLSETVISAEIGETAQLTATLLPENASDRRVEWSSADERVAIVDEDGLVTVTGQGVTEIIASTCDGSGLLAVCEITGYSGISYIDAEGGECAVYTLTGVLLRGDADREYVKNLAAGTYIIVTRSGSHMLMK